MKRIIHFLLAVSTVGLLAACSQVVSSDDSQEWSLVPSQDSTTNMTIYEAELLDNYILLDLYYMYGHKRNELDENYKVYLNKGTKQNQGNKGYCTAEFYDVCYMYSQVKDNYTQYYDPYVASEVLKRTNYSDIVVGVGAEVETVEDSDTQFLRISQVYPHSPSEKAGLLEGDIIYTIDGVSIRTEKNFNAMCTGNKGDILKFIVGRDADTIVAAVELEEYYTPTVRLHYEDSIPVIEIQEFTPQTISDSGTYGEFIAALQKTKDAKSTIIDLRNNPGGSTRQCNDISSEFLAKGDTILSDVQTMVDSVFENEEWTYIQAFDTITYTAGSDGLAKDRYIVLLADTASASCAEVVLASTITNKKSPIVGQLSYGKGIGQSFYTTYNNGLALVTTIEGFDKNWKSFHDLGILPDYEIDDPDEQMAKAVELAKKAKAKRSAGYGTKKLGHFAKALPEEPANSISSFREMKLRYNVIDKRK